MTKQQEKKFDVRDLRKKDKFVVDDQFLNGYAKFVGIYAVGVYSSLCRHANKKQKCWPSIEKIKQELDIGRNSIIQAIKRLSFWNIIKKIRVGKKLTNRYYLVDKSEWKSISEVCLREYSEVCEINFLSLRDKLHGFATQTSIVRKHNSKETQKKGGKLSKDNLEIDKFSFNKILKEMEKDKRHIQIIALYWKFKHYRFDNREQYQSALRRELRPARDLIGYSDDRIKQVMRYLDKNLDVKWTIETINKFINEDLEELETKQKYKN